MGIAWCFPSILVHVTNNGPKKDEQRSNEKTSSPKKVNTNPRFTPGLYDGTSALLQLLPCTANLVHINADV